MLCVALVIVICCVLIMATPSRRKRWPSASRGDHVSCARPALVLSSIHGPSEACVRTWLERLLFASEARDWKNSRVARTSSLPTYWVF